MTESAEAAVRTWARYWESERTEVLDTWPEVLGMDGEVGWEDWARALAAVDALRKLLGTVRDQIEGIMAPLMPDRATAVEGVGLVEKHGSGRKTVWDAQGLSGAVSRVVGARLADDDHLYLDADTGERVPPSETVRRAVGIATEIVVACCGMSPSKAWSAGALNTLGIDPKEYKASEWGGWKVRVTPGVVDTTEGDGDE